MLLQKTEEPNLSSRKLLVHRTSEGLILSLSMIQ